MAKINIRVDNEVKRQFEAICEDMGITMNTAINAFVRKAVRDNRVLFEISEEILNTETIEASQGGKKTKEGTSFDRMIDNLLEKLNLSDY